MKFHPFLIFFGRPFLGSILDEKNHLFFTLFFRAVFVGIRNARLNIRHFWMVFVLFIFFWTFSSILVGVEGI